MDHGSHTVCAEMTAEFLEFSTPIPSYQFPGLKPGDRWCLCVARWQEAFLAGCAPRVILDACHEKALEVVQMEDLQRYSVALTT
jgi:uncharacterized protein